MTRFAAVAAMAVALAGCGGDSGDQSQDAAPEADAAPTPGTVTTPGVTDLTRQGLAPTAFLARTRTS